MSLIPAQKTLLNLLINGKTRVLSGLVPSLKVARIQIPDSVIVFLKEQTPLSTPLKVTINLQTYLQFP